MRPKTGPWCGTANNAVFCDISVLKYVVTINWRGTLYKFVEFRDILLKYVALQPSGKGKLKAAFLGVLCISRYFLHSARFRESQSSLYSVGFSRICLFSGNRNLACSVCSVIFSKTCHLPLAETESHVQKGQRFHLIII